MDQMIELQKLHDCRQENSGRPVVYLCSPTKTNSVNPGITGPCNFFQMIELAENFVEATAQSKPVSKL
jgi:hypothetical protein